MGQDRIDALLRMLEQRPADTRLRFGLALEYLNSGRTVEGVEALGRYLGEADDEGNGWGRMAAALRELGRDDEAKEAYRRGIETALRHDHPTMADEFEAELDDME